MIQKNWNLITYNYRFMEEWKEYKLGQLVELKNGVAFKSNEFIEQGVPVIKIKNVKPNHILLDDLSFVSYESSLNKKCFDILPTDILITMTGNRKDGGADSWVGKVALFNHTGKYLLNQRVSAIRVKENSLVDYVYLSYLLSGWDAQLYFVNHSNSSGGQANISPDIVYNYAVSLPSLSVQYKISSILKSLDDKIEVNRKINENLEQQAQALFKSWFVDFEPFRNGEFVESELGRIPKGWRVGKLGELCVTNKRTYKGEFNVKIKYIDTGSVTNNFIESSQILDPTCDKIPSRAKRAVVEGDIIYSSVRPNQKHYALLFSPSANTVVSTGFIVITSNWSAYRYFIYEFLIQDGVIDNLQAIAEQSVSTFPSINASDITNLKVVIPPNEIVVQYANIAFSHYNKINNNQQESRRLAELRDTLLPKLMSGELKVNEIEDVL